MNHRHHTYETLYQTLTDWGIAYTHYDHVPVFTVEEAQAIDAEIPGVHIKNLFLRDAKKTQYWLVTVRHEVRVDLKALEPLIGASTRLSFGSPEALLALVGVTPGSVTPLAAINDVAGNVQVVLDAAIMGAAQVNAHPLRNDMSTGLSAADLLKFLEKTGHTPLVVEIPEKD